MGFFERLSLLVRANLNDLLGKAEDPLKILDQSVLDMQTDLSKLREAVAIAIASQRRLSSQAAQSEGQAKIWYERAELALQRGEESLAREALARRKTFQQSFSSLSGQVTAQEGQVELLKRSLLLLEGKIAQAKTKKDMLKARAQAAKAQQQLQNAVGEIDSNGSVSAFERMEQKVEALETSGKIAAEIAGSELESRFTSLEEEREIENQLNDLRNKLREGVDLVSLPSDEQSSANLLDIDSAVEQVKVSEIDSEFEELKRSVDDK